jgi:8-amino-7-oxononanoate synthase
MNAFEKELELRLQALRAEGLYRQLHPVYSPQSTRIQAGGQDLLNFSSNDYLGLANHPDVKTGAIQAVEQYGAGSGASRLICGSLAPHHELEETLADFKGTEAALTFSSGYAAALGTIGALMRKDDTVIIDKLVHASLVDAARLSGAKLRVFPHNDLDELETILKRANEHRGKSSANSDPAGVLIVTESIFSMDGDAAPLRDIVALKNQYGAWLMVDEAHATGLYGPKRRGLAEELGVSDAIEIQMGTLGKALGGAGGYISGSRRLIDLLINRGRSFIFSTAPAPSAAGAVTAAIGLVRSSTGEDLRARLWQRVAETRAGLGFQTTDPGGNFPSAILPLLIGAEARAMETAAALRSKGIWVPAVRYPAVARGTARLRLTLSASHDSTDISQLIAALSALELTSGLATQTQRYDASSGQA